MKRHFQKQIFDEFLAVNISKFFNLDIKVKKKSQKTLKQKLNVKKFHANEDFLINHDNTESEGFSLR